MTENYPLDDLQSKDRAIAEKLIACVMASVNSVFVVMERHELDDAAWFEPVIAYFTKDKADAEAARRQEAAMAAYRASGDTDDWRKPAHEVKEVTMGAL